MIDFLLNYGLQILFTIGLIYGFGLITFLVRRLFALATGKIGYAFNFVTGLIGTPIHESAHALFCLIFAHKINAFQPFRPDPETKSMGYVSHSFNRKNPYQVVGNFFIGVAPILVGMGILILSLRFLLPEVFFAATNFSFSGESGRGIVTELLSIITDLINFENFTRWQFWVFFILVMFLSFHMDLSLEDLKSSFMGLWIVILLWLIIDIPLALVSYSSFLNFTAWCVRVGRLVGVVFILSIALDLVLTIIFGIISRFLKI